MGPNKLSLSFLWHTRYWYILTSGTINTNYCFVVTSSVGSIYYSLDADRRPGGEMIIRKRREVSARRRFGGLQRSKLIDCYFVERVYLLCRVLSSEVFVTNSRYSTFFLIEFSHNNKLM